MTWVCTPCVQVEQNAVDLEGDDSEKQRTHEALKALLLSKGLISADVSTALQQPLYRNVQQ